MQAANDGCVACIREASACLMQPDRSLYFCGRILAQKLLDARGIAEVVLPAQCAQKLRLAMAAAFTALCSAWEFPSAFAHRALGFFACLSFADRQENYHCAGWWITGEWDDLCIECHSFSHP